jgi:hypothetical protein
MSIADDFHLIVALLLLWQACLVLLLPLPYVVQVFSPAVKLSHLTHIATNSRRAVQLLRKLRALDLCD